MARPESVVRPQDLGIGRLFENVRDAVIVADASTGRIVLWNPAATEVFGYPPEEALGLSVEEIVPESLKHRHRAGLSRYRDTGHGPYVDSGAVLDLPAVRKGGEEIRVELTLSPIEPLPEAEGQYVLAIARDVTERKRAEEEIGRLNEDLGGRVAERTAELEATVARLRSRERELRESEERYRLLVEGAKDYAIFLLDPEGRVTNWNEGAERLFGYREDEIVGEDGSLLFTPEDRREGVPKEEMKRAQAEGRAQDERWHVRKDGTRFFASGFVRPVLDEGRNLRGFAKVARDITEHKQAEEALRHSERSLATAQRIAHVGNWEYSVREDKALWSNELYRIFGLDPEKFVPTYTGFLERAHPEDRGLLRRAVRRALLGVEPTGVVGYRIVRPGGEVRHVESQYELSRDAAGRPEVLNGTVQDVTERKQAEEALRRGEERYRAVVEQAGEGIFLFDPRSKRILEANPAFQRMFGYSAQELRGITLYDLVPQDHGGVDRNVERAMEEGYLLVGQRRYRRKDGSEIEVEVSGGVIYYGGNEVICSAVRDVTERKRSEEALRASEERFRTLVEQSPLSMQILSPDGRTLRVNRAWEELFGATLDEIEGYNILEDRQLVEKGVMPYILRGFAGEPAKTPPIAYVPDETIPGASDHGGQERWAQAFIYPVKDDDGNVQEVVLMHEDVSEQRRAEEALRRSEKRLQDILDNSPAVVYVKDLEGRFVLINRRFEEVFGIPKEQVVGKTDHDLFPKEAADAFRANDEEVLRSKLPLEIEETAPQDDGGHVYLSVKFPLRGTDGSPYAVCGISTDITERKRVEEAVQKMREAERSRIARDLHDGALQDLAYALAEAQIVRMLSEAPTLKDRFDPMIEALKRSAQELREAVYGLRPVGDADRPLPERLGLLVEASSRISPGCDISLQIGEDFPSDPSGEGAMEVLRIVQEALTNARKHSGAENVRVSLKTDGDDVVTQVSDDGRGFVPGTGRTGVGLRSMNERAAALGGELEIESEPGKGTKVSLRTPLRNVGVGGRW